MAGVALLSTGARATAATGAQRGPALDCATIFLSEPVSAGVIWSLEVSCQLEEGDARCTVAQILTTPLRRDLEQPIRNKRGSRMIAKLHVPGARVWYVEGWQHHAFLAGENPGPRTNFAQCWIDASPGNGAGETIELLEGVLIPRQAYDWAAGGAWAGVAAFTVPQGADIQEFTVQAGTAAVTISVPGHATVTVPIGSALTIAPGVLSAKSDLTIQMASADGLSYFCSWIV